MNRISNINIACEYPLPTPAEILKEIPLTTTAEENVFNARAQVEAILKRTDKRLLLICGPCSIDNPDSAWEYALRFRKLSQQVSHRFFPIMRTYFEKPRTTVGWKGLVYDPDLDQSFQIEKGLRTARKLLLKLAEAGIPAATEFLEPIIPQYIADLISWASIGARTSESQTHRQLASGMSMPIGFKNSTDGSVAIAVDAVKTAAASHSFLGVINDGRTGVFSTKGNPLCHIVLRGGSHAPNYTSEFIAFTKELMRKKKVPTPAIVIDCSHANSDKNPANQPKVLNDVLSQINSGENAIAGIMLESYLLGGRQDITPNHKPGLSLTDACLSWDETEQIVLDACKALDKTF
mgnify:CR=1 FL=1